MFSKLATGQRVAVVLAAVVAFGGGGFLLLPYGKSCDTTLTSLIERTSVVHHEAIPEKVEPAHGGKTLLGKNTWIAEKRTPAQDAYDSGGELTPCARSAGPRAQYAVVAGLVGMGIAAAVFFTFAPKRRDDSKGRGSPMLVGAGGPGDNDLPPPPVSA